MMLSTHQHRSNRETYDHGRDSEPSESTVELEGKEQAIDQCYLIISINFGVKVDGLTAQI
jgi:hypothetical protein